MDYFISPLWFYMIYLCHNLEQLSCLVCILLLCWLAVKAIMFYLEKMDKKNEDMKFTVSKKMIIAIVISGILMFFVPNKETCIQMLVASKVSQENVDHAVEMTEDLVTSIIDQVHAGLYKGEE